MTENRHWWMHAAASDAGPPAPEGIDRSPESEGGGRVPDVSRRAFLAAAGFGMAGVMAACGRAPVQFTATWEEQPDGLVAGRALKYAATCAGCTAGCGLLVRTIDGRPIKVEGNPGHPLSRGGVCAIGQAGVLPLYDSRRLSRPRIGGEDVTWAQADAAVTEGLAQVRATGGAVRVLTHTVTSPTTRAALASFVDTFADGRHVVYDPLSASAILDAHERTHGARVLPRYHFDRARVIVGIDADFLGTWISPVEYTAGRRAARDPDAELPAFAHHVQAEAVLTVTGSNADRRLRLEPHQLPDFTAHLVKRVAERAHAAGVPAPGGPSPVPDAVLDDLAERLWQAGPAGLVVCGTNVPELQVLVNYANHLLGAYGVTLDVNRPSYQAMGDDAAYRTLLEEMEAGQVGALVVAGANPVADAPGGDRFLRALEQVPLRIGLAPLDDETTAGLEIVLPAAHALESWEDGEPVAGLLTMSQPAIRPFGEPRTLRACLAAWRGTPAGDLELLQAAWERDQFPRRTDRSTFLTFWRRAVHDGFVAVDPEPSGARAFSAGALPSRLPASPGPAGGRFALALMPSVAMRDGRHAQNPWLQELPDPISKLTWGNAAYLSPAAAGRLGVVTGDVVKIAGRGEGAPAIEIPALVQPGLADGAVAVALGYGRTGTNRFATIGPAWFEGRPTVGAGGVVGVGVSPFCSFSATCPEVDVTPVGRHVDLPVAQTYDTLQLPANTAPAGAERRDAVRETTLAGTAAAQEGHEGGHGAAEDLWPDDFPYEGHRWGMVIDLSACTGCSACVIACQAENNIPVVGADEVMRRRDMHWMRIDRYYADVPGAEGDVDVAHQPMLCHHCDHAPCETVCPVLATVHDAQGLNTQVYNRCVGTRYCANNCPYKVRRFNWFAYDRGDARAELVLNPSVTVRSRGVMEKCSFCVQRIHEARAEAKRKGEALTDGAVKTACQDSCPASAIVFGDLNDPESAVSRHMQSGRAYRVLEELNVRPSLGYLKKVRDRQDGTEGAHHG
ncbi:MAG: 4Fe-4S dicluster domain-containing protein [Planctomycetota bacterium]|jgi:molybdopterin-containing oxidoreductase family iron-sulfur binding subunit